MVDLKHAEYLAIVKLQNNHVWVIDAMLYFVF